MQRVSVGFLGLAMLVAWALPANAHEVDATGQTDDRWLPWIGCWEDAPDAGDIEADPLAVCLRFLDDGDGAELLTYQGGELLSREEIRADGAPTSIAEGGCSGERFARWSADGHRLFLTSEMRCGEGMARTTRGVMSVLPDRRSWVEIHGVEAGGEAPFVGARTFVPASQSTMAEIGIQPPEAEIGLAVSTARSHAAQALTVESVAEAVAVAGPSVAAALLVERRESFALDARTARALVEQGVPGEVLDVMVALDNPQRFEIDGGMHPVRAEPSQPGSTRPSDRAAAPWPPRGTPYGYGSSWGLYGRAGYGSFFYDPFLYDPFYDPFYSRRFGSGLYYSPRVVFVGAPEVRDRTRVDPQRGYSNPQETGRRATPSTTRPSGPSSNNAPTTTRSPNTRSGTSSGGAQANPQGGYSGSSGGERRARPRDGGDD